MRWFIKDPPKSQVTLNSSIVKISAEFECIIQVHLSSVISVTDQVAGRGTEKHEYWSFFLTGRFSQLNLNLIFFGIF